MSEKMKILKMLESGTISATEAATLLQSLEKGEDVAMPVPNSQTHTPEPAPKRDIVREWEPRVKSFTETVAEKIADGAEYLSKALSSPSTPKHTPPAVSHKGTATEQSIEMLVVPGYNELNLAGLNGEVRIKGYNGDKITAKLHFRKKNPRANIELMKLGNKYFLKYDLDEFERVSLDAYVPERLFNIIKIEGINCRVDITSLASGDIVISNQHGDTHLAGIACNNFSAEGGNGKFIISNIIADNAKIENVNGSVDASELDIERLSLTNYNGPLSLIMSKYDRYSNYDWRVETGNAKLNMHLPTLPSLGYHIKAHAAMSEIRLGLTGMQFLINDKSLVEARSVSFESSSKKVKLAVETSNAPLVIN